jgi:hypothetical protein
VTERQSACVIATGWPSTATRQLAIPLLYSATASVVEPLVVLTVRCWHVGDVPVLFS